MDTRLEHQEKIKVYWDEDEKWHYYYNEETGESWWKEEDRILVDREVLTDTEGTIRNYVYCFWFHALIFECPCALIEAATKSCIYAFLSIFFWVGNPRRGLMYFREALLFVGLVPILPLSICFVYGKFHAEADEWSLAVALPTLCGRVDVRRLSVFVLGQGYDAADAHLNFHQDSLDSWPGTILHPPRASVRRFRSFLSKCFSLLFRYFASCLKTRKASPPSPELSPDPRHHQQHLKTYSPLSTDDLDLKHQAPYETV